MDSAYEEEENQGQNVQQNDESVAQESQDEGPPDISLDKEVPIDGDGLDNDSEKRDDAEKDERAPGIPLDDEPPSYDVITGGDQDVCEELDQQAIVESDPAVMEISNIQDEPKKDNHSHESKELQLDGYHIKIIDVEDQELEPLFEEKSGTFVYNYGPDNLPGLTAWKLVRSRHQLFGILKELYFKLIFCRKRQLKVFLNGL